MLLFCFCTWLSQLIKTQAKLEWQQAWRYAVCSCPVEAHILEAYLAWHPDVLTSTTKAGVWLARGGMCMRLFVALHHLILRHVSTGDHQINRGVSGSTAKSTEEVPARE